ncbi:protein-disulfide reductase DsbD [Marinomonas sp. 2405UD68-3]|uniref:protein-disulfide reductase DsbD n=1 Tax=Marinomonas sp. 2405UD68-3 TaxID=3391835 RepID=UPI0039C8F237
MRFIFTIILLCIASVVQAFDVKLPFSSQQPTFLNVNQAFQLSISAPKDGAIRATWIVADGYYLYQHQFKLKGKDSDTLSFAPFSKGEAKHDAYFGDVIVYRDRFTAEIQYDTSLPEGHLIQASLGYQGCADKGLCYPPQLEPFEFPVPASSENTKQINNVHDNPKSIDLTKKKTQIFTPSSTNSVITLLAENSWLTAAMTLFGLGLLLSMTPCVLPMVPIVSAIVVGNKKEPLKAFYYSALYVISMALTYALIGGLVGFFGLQLNLQAYLQDPIVLIISAILFIVLAFSMFGLFELRMPAFIQPRINANASEKLSNKSLGVCLSAVFATLVVSPCVSAPLAGVLLFISSQGETLYGALMLFIMALGMGVPLLLVGIFGPSILPKSGEWLEDIKVLMGFGLIGVATWLITRWINIEFHLYLWGILLISIGSYFLHSLIIGKLHPVRLIITSVTLLIGSLYFIGGASSQSSLLHPLGSPSSATSSTTINKQEELTFATVTSLQELDLFIQSTAQKAPIMLDFYADWCISCKVIEHEIFYDKSAYSMLKNMTLVRVDVTKNDVGNQKIMQHYKVFGPPSLIFLTPIGDELNQLSLQGEPSLREVIERLSYLEKEFSQYPG